MAQIYLLNGANLNWLGRRDPKIYGTDTLALVEARVARRAETLGLAVTARQTNREGELTDWIQEAAAARAVGIILNPGAYAHTSFVLHDSILDAKEAGVPTVEVHISNIHAREPFRHTSVISGSATAIINGCGTHGYLLALEFLAHQRQATSRKGAVKRTAKKKVAKTKAKAKKTTRKKATRKKATRKRR